jgi:hypothetical protein
MTKEDTRRRMRPRSGNPLWKSGVLFYPQCAVVFTIYVFYYHETSIDNTFTNVCFIMQVLFLSFSKVLEFQVIESRVGVTKERTENERLDLIAFAI